MGGGAPLIIAPLRADIRPGGRRATKSKAFLLCPVCTAPMQIRDSSRETDTFKKLTLACSNAGCMHSSVWDVMLRHVLNPGVNYDPAMNLPMCPRAEVPQIYPPSHDAETDARQASMFDTGQTADTG